MKICLKRILAFRIFVPKCVGILKKIYFNFIIINFLKKVDNNLFFIALEIRPFHTLF